MRVFWRGCCQLLIIRWGWWKVGWASALLEFISIHTIQWPPLAPKTFSELANFHESKWGHFPPFFFISSRLFPRELRRKALSCCHLCNYQLWTWWQFVVVVDFFCYANVPAHSLSVVVCFFFFPTHSIKRNITHLISCYHLFPCEIFSSYFLVFRLVRAKEWHFEFWRFHFYLLFTISVCCQ